MKKPDRQFFNRHGYYAPLVISIVIIASVFVINYYSSKSSESIYTSYQSQNLTSEDDGLDYDSQSSLATPEISNDTNPQSESYTIPKPTQIDNSTTCKDIATKKQSELESLNVQIVEQLQIMRTIIGNDSLNGQIISRGGSLNQMLRQNQINITFDQANETAKVLIDKYGTIKNSYQNQIFALLNTNSPGCSTILKSLVGM